MLVDSQHYGGQIFSDFHHTFTRLCIDWAVCFSAVMTSVLESFTAFRFFLLFLFFFSVLFSHNIHKDADNGPEASCVVRQAFFCMSLQLSQLACSGLHRVYSMCLPFALIAAVGSIVVLFSECRSRNELRRCNATTNCRRLTVLAKATNSFRDIGRKQRTK